MKRLFIIFITNLIVLTSFAQSFNIKGKVVDEDSIPVVSANIVLYNADNQLIQGVETNDAGEFTLQNLSAGGDYKLTLSFVGCENQEFGFEKPAQDIDLQTIVLIKSSEQLEGAKVVATKILADRRIVYPTVKQKENSGDGVTLLNAMKLPALSVVPASNTIIYWGRNGNLQLFINDVPASTEQILALAAKDVIYIEYIDKPDAKYTDAGLVINYVVKRFESGITGNANVEKTLNNTNMLKAGIMLKANYKNSEFGLDYRFSNGKETTGRTDREITDEIFNFADGTQLHRYNDPVDVFAKYNNHTVALSYVYNKPQNTLFYVKAQYNRNNLPVCDVISDLYNFGTINDTTSQAIRQNNNSNQWYSEIFYRKQLGEKQTLEFKFYNTLNYTTQKNAYREYKNAQLPDLTNIQNIVDGKSRETMIRTDYRFAANKNNSLSTGVLFINTHLNNQYSGTSNGLVKIDNSRLTSYITYRGRSDKFIYLFDLLFRMNNTSQENVNDYTRYEFQPRAYIAYKFTKDSWITYNLTNVPRRPALSQISNVEQIIDDLQVRRGNPFLKTPNSINQTLNIYFYNFFGGQIVFTSAYDYNPKYIAEETFIDNNKFVRMPFNMKYNHAFYNECEISEDAGFIDISYAFGYSRYINKSETYRHYYGKWHYRLNASLTLFNWRLNATIWNHNNAFYGETMYTSGRAMYFTLMRTWLKGNLTTALTCINPFSDYSKEGNVNHSAVAPYSNWSYKNHIHRLLMFNVSYRFNYGRNPVTNVSTSSNVNTDSGIVKDNKKVETKNEK